MMIRKITHLRTSDKKIGRPQELAFYMQFNQLVSDSDILIQTPPDPAEDKREAHDSQPEIKICEEDEQANRDAQNHQNIPNNQNKEKRVSAINKELQILGICKDRNPDEPLTYREIMNGYDGFFIGRLLRLKQTLK